jgi:hypothetical protein
VCDVLWALHPEDFEEIHHFIASRAPPQHLIEVDAAALWESLTHHICDVKVTYIFGHVEYLSSGDEHTLDAKFQVH